MAKDSDEILKKLRNVLYGADRIDIPDSIAERVRDADRALRDARATHRAGRRDTDPLGSSPGFATGPLPAFGLDGDGEDDAQSDPIEDMLRDDE